MVIKLGLALLEAEKRKKKSKPIIRLIASLDDNYRELVWEFKCEFPATYSIDIAITNFVNWCIYYYFLV